ncbi:hypothetical protein SCATT_56550 [Streptantibioticus cattleyicolor NRRL 8057 = DSM 46488]|uniref:Uncharacterized protein n=1 Tax=Streptantibioticus cattleyicolor (strain ATCC 35852 / DSM 46488 / JCM 4925 / NBRC 14057 / NRRL 8057) TaxID=1003195 RepID=G8X430_STREN|nr:hypothetical protein SCATT_56550 [Streptantibioticus cattleyicolor NRRL 8057 = DSM 46488]
MSSPEGATVAVGTTPDGGGWARCDADSGARLPGVFPHRVQERRTHGPPVVPQRTPDDGTRHPWRHIHATVSTPPVPQARSGSPSPASKPPRAPAPSALLRLRDGVGHGMAPGPAPSTAWRAAADKGVDGADVAPSATRNARPPREARGSGAQSGDKERTKKGDGVGGRRRGGSGAGRVGGWGVRGGETGRSGG